MGVVHPDVQMEMSCLSPKKLYFLEILKEQIV